MWASPGSNIEQKNEKVPGNICRMSYSRLCCQHPLWLLAMASFSLDKIRTPLPFVWVLESCNFQDRGRDYPMKLVFIYTLEWVVLPLSTFYFNTYFNVAMTETREENNSSTSLFSRFILSLWSSQRCPSERLERYILKKNSLNQAQELTRDPS